MARLRVTLAKNYIEQGELDRSLLVLALAKTDAAKVQDWLYLGFISNLSGYVNERLGRYKNSNKQYQLSVKYYKNISNASGQVVALNNLAKLALEEKNYKRAFKYIQHSVELVIHSKLKILKPETMKLLAKIESKQ